MADAGVGKVRDSSAYGLNKFMYIFTSKLSMVLKEIALGTESEETWLCPHHGS